jgi:hypothetical protein
MQADQQAAYAAAFAADLERLRASARDLPFPVRVRLDGLLPRLAPADQRALLELVLLADEAGFEGGVAEVGAQWARVVAHFGPLGAAIHAVHEHVVGDGFRCAGDAACARLTAPPDPAA